MAVKRISSRSGNLERQPWWIQAGIANEISGLIATQTVDQPGGIFVRASEQISNEDRILFQTVARIIISSNGASLADHVNKKASPKAVIPVIPPSPLQSYTSSASAAVLSEQKTLPFLMGLGDFHRMAVNI